MTLAGGKSAYRVQVDQERILQIREISRELPQACGDFLRYIAITTGTFTRLAYAIDLKTFFQFLHRERVHFADKPPVLLTDDDLARLTASDLVAFTEYLTYYVNEDESGRNAGRTFENHEVAIKRKLCSIRAFYEYLFQQERIPANVTQLVPLPQIHEKPILRLSRTEMEKLLHVAETGESLTDHQRAYQALTANRDYALLMLFLGTGIRVSECVAINLTDVDFDEKAFVVTRKGGNQMILYMPDEVVDAMRIYYDERIKIETMPGHEEAFFLSMQKRRLTQRAIQNLVKKYAKIAAPLKSRISPHKLRSTFATNLYQETSDIYLVANVLGHASVDTTRKHYADMTIEDRRKAAKRVRLTESAEQTLEVSDKAVFKQRVPASAFENNPSEQVSKTANEPPAAKIEPQNDAADGAKPDSPPARHRRLGRKLWTDEDTSETES